MHQPPTKGKSFHLKAHTKIVANDTLLTLSKTLEQTFAKTSNLPTQVNSYDFTCC